MSLHRLRPRRDASEPAIVEALEAYGFSVVKLSIPGGPDLLLGRQGVTRVAEVKTGRARLRPAQRAWWDAWRGNQAILLRSLEDIEVLVRSWLGPLNGVTSACQ
jgi:hypothetical protein